MTNQEQAIEALKSQLSRGNREYATGVLSMLAVKSDEMRKEAEQDYLADVQFKRSAHATRMRKYLSFYQWVTDAIAAVRNAVACGVDISFAFNSNAQFIAETTRMIPVEQKTIIGRTVVCIRDTGTMQLGWRGVVEKSSDSEFLRITWRDKENSISYIFVDETSLLSVNGPFLFIDFEPQTSGD